MTPVCSVPSGWLGIGALAHDGCCAPVILACTVIIIAALVGFASVVAAGWESASWVGPYLSLAVAVVITSVLPAIAWFNTYELSFFIVGSATLSVLLHSCGHLLLWRIAFPDNVGMACVPLDAHVAPC